MIEQTRYRKNAINKEVKKMSKKMALPYPYELRIRVIGALESKMTVSQIMKIFNVCRDTVYKWKKRKDTTGDVKAKIGYQSGRHRKVIKDEEEFLRFIEFNKSKSVKELAAMLNISPSTVQRALKRINYTYKKNLLSPKTRYGGKGEF